MKLLWALVMALASTSPVLAEDCRSAGMLERQLFESSVEPFVADLQPAKPDQDWRIGSNGGFHVAAPGLGEIILLGADTATTSCGLELRWHSYWNDRRITSASRFKLVEAVGRPEPRQTVKFRATTFRVTPDKASQTAWLSVTYSGRTYDYLLNFPATAIVAVPVLHSGAVQLKLMGVRTDERLVYAEFSSIVPP